MINAGEIFLPFSVQSMKSAIMALFRPQVDFATQERILKGFSR